MLGHRRPFQGITHGSLKEHGGGAKDDGESTGGRITKRDGIPSDDDAEGSSTTQMARHGPGAGKCAFQNP